MGYSDQSEYPSGRFTTAALTNAAQDVGVAGEDVKVSHLIATGGAAAEIIIFRNSAGATEYFRLPVGIGETVIPAGGFEANLGGLEVLTDSAAGDVSLTIFFWQQ